LLGKCGRPLPDEKASVELGTLSAIWRYPVKSLAAESLMQTRVDTDGIPGDRVSALFAGDGHERAGKTYEGIHDDRLHLWKRAGDAVADAGKRGVQLAERSGEGPYHFSLPISLVFDRWIAEVEESVGQTLDARRWRPNLVARARAGFDLSEGDLIGCTISVGTVVLRVVKPIKRCVVPSYDLSGGPSTPEVQTFVVRERANVMGVYCEIESAGALRVGDPLTGTPQPRS
jgi:uncharacterized protein YcbX